MKALTLRQPWASLIAVGAKRIETRSWRTSYRGPLAIHAGLHRPTCGRIRDIFYSAMPLGAIVATAQLVDCVPIIDAVDALACPEPPFVYADPDFVQIHHDAESAPEYLAAERDYGDYTPGRWAWLLDDVQPTTERCPWCWGSMTDPVSDEGWYYNGIREPGSSPGCPVCVSAEDGYPVGHCDPIPAKGRQGLWEWTP